MAELSELAQRMLSELEEASEENFAALINTVITTTGLDAELNGFGTAVRTLCERDLTRVAVPDPTGSTLVDLSLQASLDVADSLHEILTFRSSDRIWTWVRTESPGDPTGRPYLVTTARGKEMASELLSRRGYQWWRVSNKRR